MTKSSMTMMIGNRMTIRCPECDGNIRFKKKPVVNQQLTCGHCNTKLEVVQTNPLELWAVDDEEEMFKESASRKRPGGKQPTRRRRSEDDWN